MSRAEGVARRPVRLLLGRDGVTALEFALVAPVAITLLLGGVEFGRALHTRSTLQFAVERAARCAAIDKNLCGTPDAIKAYAANLMTGRGIGASTFSTTSTNCGRQVSASLDFALTLPKPFANTVKLTAASCYPTT